MLIDLHFFIYAAFGQIFNPIAKLVIPIGKPSKEAKPEIEIYPVTVKANKRKYSI